MSFCFQRLEIPDIVMIEPTVFQDERGFFMESYKYSDFANFGIKEHFVQDNHSRSARGVLRGLHYQNPPNAQGKLVRVIEGEVYDVAVDIRRGSRTYGMWIGALLSEENKRMLYIPEGFAHGFLALSQVAEVIYKTTEEYAPKSEAGIIWNDPEIGIKWPIESPTLAPKDARWPALSEAVNGFVCQEGEGR
jgi:dTDP-4-dehydrorhamnose 3,5-epimerase